MQALKHFLPDLRDHHVVGAHRQHSGGLLHHHQGGLYRLAHQILVWSQDKLLSLRAVHIPGHLNMGSRHPVEAGAEARGMDALPRGGEADMESFWPGSGGFVCDSSEFCCKPGSHSSHE